MLPGEELPLRIFEPSARIEPAPMPMILTCNGIGSVVMRFPSGQVEQSVAQLDGVNLGSRHDVHCFITSFCNSVTNSGGRHVQR